MSYYRIVNWDEHYEVDNHGKLWEPGQPFRKGPLQYIRVRARRDWNVRLLELHDHWGEQVWLVLGIFGKLCQIVGVEERRQREGGIIRNCDGAPATDGDICRMLGLEPETWKAVAASLCDPQIHWLTENGTPAAAENPQQTAEIPETPTSPGIPGIPGIPLSKQNKTNQITSKENKTRQDKAAPVVLGQLVGHLVADHDSSRLASGPGFLDSSRLGFLATLRQLLGATAPAEARTVSNFEQWVHENVSSGRAGPELRARALAIAKGSTYGHKPAAVFMARVQRELGYTPPTRRTGQATGKGIL